MVDYCCGGNVLLFSCCYWGAQLVVKYLLLLWLFYSIAIGDNIAMLYLISKDFKLK